MLLLSTNGFADVIVFKSGKVVEGSIIKKADIWIKVKVVDENRKDYYLLEDIESINGENPNGISPKKKFFSKKLFSFSGRKEVKPAPSAVILHFKDGNLLKGKLLRRSKYYLVIKPDGDEHAKEILWSKLSSIEEIDQRSSRKMANNDQEPVFVEIDIDQVEDVKMREVTYGGKARSLKHGERKAFRESFRLTEEQEEEMYAQDINRGTKKVDVATVFGRNDSKFDFEMGSEVSKITYEEPGIMQEKGNMNGVYGVLTYRFDENAKRKARMNVWDAREKFGIIRLDGKGSWGSVDYDSQNTGDLSGVTDYMIEVRSVLGYELPVKETVTLTPYAGFGFRYLNDNLNGTTTTNNWGYERESRYYYLPIGIEARIKLKKNWVIGFMAEYDYFLNGTQKSHLEDGGLRVQDSETGTWYVYDMLLNEQDEGHGIRGSFTVMKKTKRVDLFIEPFVRYWSIKASDPQQLTSNGGTILWYQDAELTIPATGIEPENRSTEYGLKFGAKF